MRKNYGKLTAMILAVTVCAFTACGSSKGEQGTQGDAPADSGNVDIDYGSSQLFTRDELEDAVGLIRDEFDNWDGCEMRSLTYAGDDNNTEDNKKWLGSMEDTEYDAVCEFTCDFITLPDAPIQWEPDEEYKDYQFWLGQKADGGWDLVTWGY